MISIVAGIIFLVTIDQFQVRRVESGSMEPVMPIGSLIFAWHHQEYTEGDIITFHADNGEVVTHTLIGFNDDGSFQTKGQANAKPDAWSEPVTSSDVIGQVVAITAVTTVQFWFSTPGTLIIVILVLMALVHYWPEKKSHKPITS